MFTKFLSLLVLTLFVAVAPAKASVLGGTSFQKIIYLSAATDTTTKNAANDGRDYASAKGFFDGDLMAIPSDVIITNVYAIIDVAVVGPTAFNIGDDDTASGFIASSAPTGTLAAVGLAWWEVGYKGAYLKGGSIVTNGLLAKYYSATGKEVKLDVTGTASAGKMRVVVEGFAVGKSGL